jgi:hypothetical protein
MSSEPVMIPPVFGFSMLQVFLSKAEHERPWESYTFQSQMSPKLPAEQRQGHFPLPPPAPLGFANAGAAPTNAASVVSTMGPRSSRFVLVDAVVVLLYWTSSSLGCTFQPHPYSLFAGDGMK